VDKPFALSTLDSSSFESIKQVQDMIASQRVVCFSAIIESGNIRSANRRRNYGNTIEVEGPPESSNKA
jgi:hypothetical protein